MAQLRLRTRLALALAGPRDPTVETVDWLAAHPRAASTSALSRILTDKFLPWTVRQAAARALGELSPPAGTRSLGMIVRTSLEFEVCEEATLALAQRGEMEAVAGCLRLIDGLITNYIGQTQSDEENLETIAEHRVAEALDVLGAPAVEPILDPGSLRGRARRRGPLQRPDDARIVALLRIGPSTIAPVVCAVSSPSSQTAACAARVAARVAGENAIPALVDALGHRSADVRIGAVRSLRHMRAPALCPHLAGLLQDRSQGVREEAARAAVDLKAASVTPVLVELLRHRSSRTRAMAVDSLSELRAPELGPHLAALITDDDERVQELAVGAAGMLRARSSVSALLSLTQKRSGYLSIKAAEALGDIGDPSAVEPLCQMLGDPRLSRSAGMALAKIGPPGEEALLKISDSADETRRIAALNGLLAVDTKATLDRLLAAIDDPGSPIRLQDWVGLTVPIRLELLTDPRPHVRAAAAGVFDLHPDPRVVERLHDLARRDPVVQVRAQALHGLPGTDPDAIALRLAEIHSAHPDMRLACVVSLGIFKPSGALEALRAQYDRETDPEVKQELARYLSEPDRI